MPEGVWLGTRYWYGAHDNELNKKFVANYKQKYGTPPSYNAEGAYVAVHAFKAAIEKAGNTDGKAVAQALSGLSLETRSEEHTSELQSLMRISYAVFCLKT